MGSFKKAPALIAGLVFVWAVLHHGDSGFGLVGHGYEYYRTEFTEYLKDGRAAAERIRKHLLLTFESMRTTEKGYSDTAEKKPRRFVNLEENA